MKEQVAKSYFSKELLTWYRSGNRDLPWRKNRDPYRIWVSEIMLQQTRVDTVIPYYHTFMSKFPTVRTLAEAPEEEVLKCWEGLGYYSRARNLQAGAKMVVEKYDGIIPDDKTAVSELKGVGPYTSGAIMSIAFNRPEPAVDGNVMRVLSRFFCLEDDIAKPATRVGIEKLVVTLIPDGAAGDFNQALMELGALVCTPKSPSCLPCPVMEHCEARIMGKELELPIKTKAKAPRKEYRSAVIVLGKGENEGKILVRQRPATGLLAQMWELPHLQVADDKIGWFSDSAPKEQSQLAELLGRMIEEDTGLLIRPKSWLMDADHIFSHIVWKMRVYVTDLGEESLSHSHLLAAESTEPYLVRDVKDRSGEALMYRWIGKEDMEQLPFPNLFLKILQHYWT
ncbi:A/G-specific adenine glycosylase [Paenibacillus sp. L3-i20]|uniref:A/G-specific adenine glycosylase n=1 Tax=Paenibacillus sp. L3-i20 TaxID=2905833 RepID=UPI001EDE40E9|nr:A/G-specific adenine glycosylase [Paenibacillus sp. L3-i20]GKU80422.1 A/G-specific adenine glycosylase [Paenibacillus sp. L3-i20]